MTAEELWDETKSLLGKSSVPTDRLRETLAKLVSTPQGLARLLRGIDSDQKLTGKSTLLRHLARVMDPSAEPSASLGQKERSELLEQATRASRSHWRSDATYWVFLWLRLRTGQASVAADAARDLKTLNDGCGTPQELAKRLTTLRGWGNVPRDRWVELVDKARAAEPSAEFRPRLQQLAELLKDGGAASPQATSPTPVVPPGAAKPLPSGSRDSDPSPRGAGIPVDPAPAAAASGPESRAGGDPPGPDDHRPHESQSETRPEEKESKPSTTHPTTGDPASPTVGTTASLPTDVRPEPGESKEVRPRRTSQKRTRKEAVAPPETDTVAGGTPTEPSVKTAKSGGAARSLASPAPGGEDLPAVLAELTSAVRAVSLRIDQLAGRTSDVSALEQRLVELERRLAGVERALSETQTSAQRASDEADRLRTLVREREQELQDAVREQDDARNRVAELTRRLAAADARIEAAESRADQNIHEAFRERDAAVLTFKARLWDAVQAQLADVSDPTPGEQFGSTEEEVLTTRLRRIRDALRAEGVPPT